MNLFTFFDVTSYWHPLFALRFLIIDVANVLMNSTSETDYFVIPSELSSREILSSTEMALENGKKVVLNSLPPQKIRRKLLRYVSIAVFDEQQIGELTGVEVHNIESAKIAALKLYGRGAETVMIKIGGEKRLIFNEEVFSFVDSLQQEVDWVSNLSLKNIP